MLRLGLLWVAFLAPAQLAMVGLRATLATFVRFTFELNLSFQKRGRLFPSNNEVSTGGVSKRTVFGGKGDGEEESNVLVSRNFGLLLINIKMLLPIWFTC